MKLSRYGIRVCNRGAGTAVFSFVLAEDLSELALGSASTIVGRGGKTFWGSRGDGEARIVDTELFRLVPKRSISLISLSTKKELFGR